MPSQPAPVSLCLIVKDEARLAESLAPVRPWVKQICVVDTGSGPEEIERLMGLQRQGLIDTLERGGAERFLYDAGCQHEPKCTGVPIDFSKARNASFALATEPWLMWMDGDDLIDGIERLPEVIAKIKDVPGDVQVYFSYEYQYEEIRDAAGNITLGRCSFANERERLMRNTGKWTWIDPVHETCGLRDGLPLRLENWTEIVWKHGRQRTGKSDATSVARNRAIYEMYWKHASEGEPVSHRMALYTGMTLALENVEPETALRFLYVAFDKAGIDEDRMVAAKELVNLLIHLRRLRDARPIAFSIIAAKPDWPDGYVAVARLAFEEARASGWKDRRAMEHVVEFAKLAADRPYRRWMANPLDRLNAMTNAVICLDQMLRWREALELSERALKEFPGDGHATANRDLFDATLKCGEAEGLLGVLKNYRDRGVARGSIDALAKKLSALLPSAEEKPPEIEKAPLREDGRLRITIATPPWMAPWDGVMVYSPEWKGGGSEVAIAELAKRLAALGHEVVVLANTGAVKAIDGATWGPAMRGPVDVFIAWRYADLFETAEAERARLRILWLHDVLAHNANEERLALADVVVVLSEFHKQAVMSNHPSLPAEKFTIVRSGADARRFIAKAVTRNRKKVVHTSSPDRGLEILLGGVWERVLEEEPDVELHLFYGFEMWIHANPEAAGKLLARVRELEGKNVILRKRVSADELAEELLSAGVWCYPCTWPEIFCVAAVEAQMAGCRIVTTNAGSLPEVVRTGEVVDPADDVGIARAIVRAIRHRDDEDKPDRATIARSGMESFLLEPIGKLWEDLMKRSLLDRLELPPYVSQA